MNEYSEIYDNNHKILYFEIMQPLMSDK
jgi:hypothetical protein